MPRKDWLKVKRGLIIDPKHRDRMGECVWLYLYILDRAEYERGLVIEWRDEAECEALVLPITTLRKQRRKLEREGYISCKQRQHYIQITVSKWIDPRPPEGDHPRPPSKLQGDRQGDRQGDHPRPPSARPYKEVFMCHVSGGERDPREDWAVQMYEVAYPARQLSIPGQELITREVKDRAVWSRVVELWTQNGHIPHPSNMVDRYKRELGRAKAEEEWEPDLSFQKAHEEEARQVEKRWQERVAKRLKGEIQ